MSARCDGCIAMRCFGRLRQEFYLDVEVWEAVRRTRRRMVLILGIVILTAAIVLAVFGK